MYFLFLFFMFIEYLKSFEFELVLNFAFFLIYIFFWKFLFQWFLNPGPSVSVEAAVRTILPANRLIGWVTFLIKFQNDDYSLLQNVIVYYQILFLEFEFYWESYIT